MKKHLTIVIKLGTSSIVAEGTHEPLLSTLSTIVETAVSFRRDGHRVILVSSGAIGMALRRMNLPRRPKHLPQVQALAAIGQSHLMALWEGLFGQLRQPIAQVLLTRNDIAERPAYRNAANTLQALLAMGVVPVVNENDTLSVAEIKFGDNDTLSAIAAAMVGADYLFLMTDVDCLYDRNPRVHPDARPIEVVRDVAELASVVDVTTGGSALGTGGMETKLVAARLATSAGVTTVITRSSKPGNVRDIVRYVEAQREQERTLSTPTDPPTSVPDPTTLSLDDLALTAATTTTPPSSVGALTPASLDLEPPPRHTRFLPAPHPIRDRSFWLLHGLAPHGTLFIDEGAHRALADKAGLLPVGVVDVSGSFSQQEAVRLCVVKKVRRGEMGGHSTVEGGRSGNESNAVVEPGADLVSCDEGTAAQGTATSEPSAQTPATDPSLDSGRHPTPPLEVGRALVNYSAVEIRRVKGLQSDAIAGVLGYADSEYIALRENIAFFATGKTDDP